MKFVEFLKEFLFIGEQDESQDKFKEMEKLVKTKPKAGYVYSLSDGTKCIFKPSDLYVYPFEDKQSIHKEFLEFMFPGHCFSIDKPTKCVYMCVYDGYKRRYLIIEGEGEKELVFD